MNNKTRFLIIVLLIFCAHNATYAQNAVKDTTRTDSLNIDGSSRFHPQTIINVGVGLTSPIDLMPFNIGKGEPNLYNPTANLLTDFKFSKKQSIGIGLNFFVLPWPKIKDGIQTINGGNSYRLNLSAREAFYIVNSSSLEVYVGFRLGTSLWLIGSHPSFPYYYYLSSYDAQFQGQSAFISLSLQALLGMRYFVSRRVGIHFEIGIGAPYITEAGFSFRFKYNPNKK